MLEIRHDGGSSISHGALFPSGDGADGLRAGDADDGAVVLSMGGLIANAWLIKTNRFAPLSRGDGDAADAAGGAVRRASVSPGGDDDQSTWAEFLVMLIW